MAQNVPYDSIGETTSNRGVDFALHVFCEIGEVPEKLRFCRYRWYIKIVTRTVEILTHFFLPHTTPLIKISRCASKSLLLDHDIPTLFFFIFLHPGTTRRKTGQKGSRHVVVY
jgi:hypothetical protein